jgi:hypothetical protein
MVLRVPHFPEGWVERCNRLDIAKSSGPLAIAQIIEQGVIWAWGTDVVKLAALVQVMLAVEAGVGTDQCLKMTIQSCKSGEQRFLLLGMLMPVP